MKKQTVKLTIVLLVVLIGIWSIALVVQNHRTLASLQSLSDQDLKQLHDNEQRTAHTIFEAMERAVAESLQRGEMEKFSRQLADQRCIDNVMEFSLFDRDGNVSHSSNETEIGRKIEPDVARQIENSEGLTAIEKEGTIELYRPHMVVADCVRCHNTWKTGESGGVGYLKYSTASTEAAKRQAASTIAETRQDVVYGSAITLVVSLLVATVAIVWLIRRMIFIPVVQPLAAVASGFEILSKGDLTVRVENDGHNEMADAFNHFVDRLHNDIGRIAKGVRRMSSSGEMLGGSSERLAGTAAEAQQASSNTASAVEEMSVTMDSVSGSTGDMATSFRTIADAVGKLASSATDMAESADSASAQSSQAATLVSQSNETVTRLAGAAEEIGRVVEVIHGIAEQTNLLALNATIEAARAGDAGRGFAVVASEVKQLANQTAKATDDIKKRVAAIQDGSSEAITSIGEINSVIEQVDELSRLIAESTETQSSESRLIAERCGECLSSADSVSQCVNESASATREIAESVTRLDQSSRVTAEEAQRTQVAGTEINDLAHDIEALVTVFKL
ncbi:Methyl-accepting chemotaxis protein PctB [Planctomycetes bacterium CA13]|uniref:Methyl-accepting chemotaxis protein PctB n=1 Tax=Novipirellula herctigrandis TaxID=2527986 RepID=A0A5C5ZA36_9BACT|nr:Methyl-accepting chemotaxis protein PctB [Planctomycetes bacterium CA13]